MHIQKKNNICPENCYFCPGMGLSQQQVGILSCAFWPKANSLERSVSMGNLYYPTKFLNWTSWERLRHKIPDDSHVIVLLGENEFQSEVLELICSKYSSEVWVIPNREFDAKKALQKISENLFERIYFYCPLYDRDSDIYYTSQELVKIFNRINAVFPNLPIRTPKKMDVFNPTLNEDGFTSREEVVFKSADDSDKINISVIIPAYNCQVELPHVLRALKSQNAEGIAYEVSVVDDGSSDQTLQVLEEIAKSEGGPENFQVIHFPRQTKRSMGDFDFRAGLARNIGAKLSRGNIFAFLDADIVVPPNYIRSLYKSHLDFDVVQVQRLYLSEKASEFFLDFSSVDPKFDVFHPEGGYWKKFFQDERDWQSIPNFWKYVCTYGLSVSSQLFHKVGGFRRSFNSYGFEDTDLGFRLKLENARFLKSELKTYHLWHSSNRSEFGNSELRRMFLLRRSANIFFRNNLAPEIFEELYGLLKESRPLSRRIIGLVKR